MHLIVVGAGPVGESLIRLALKGGHDVVLIEEDEARAEAAAQAHDALVLNAAIAEADIMDEARADRADALIAATADDSANLMAMVLGLEYEIENLISIVNHKHHQPLFDRLGVRILVDPEIIVAQHLLDLVLHPNAEDVTTLPGREQIYKLRLSGDSRLAGMRLQTLDEDGSLPKDTYIISIERDGKDFFPRADTELQGGDGLILFARRPLTDDELAAFTGKQ